ncbi:MAG: hypothetical protein RRC34_06925 [Lentisphaeria bacterium]|nr:hypothetical protein [Lentisphaeria bacterium]
MMNAVDQPPPFPANQKRLSDMWRTFWTPKVTIVVVVLAVAAVSFQFVVGWLGLFFSKEELPLRIPLFQLSSRFGPYEMENEDPALTPEIEAVLGARAYVTREYYDTRKGKGDPGSLIRLHIAYFTGTPDPVIHVPDVCYIAAGAQGLKKEIETVRLESPAFQALPDGRAVATAADGSKVTLPSLDIAMLAFDFVTDGMSTPSTVTYFFAANGRFMGDTGNVRKLVIHITDRYAYWAKIEVLPLGVGDREQALNVVKEFLSAALPEIMLCLPDWGEVKAGNYPPDLE